MYFEGLPKNSGLTPVEAVINEHIDPQSGINPSTVGQLKSGFTPKKIAPFLINLQALDKLSYFSDVSKPQHYLQPDLNQLL